MVEASSKQTDTEVLSFRLGTEEYGIGTVGERMLILLDIERLMTAPEVGLVSSASNALPLAA